MQFGWNSRVDECICFAMKRILKGFFCTFYFEGASRRGNRGIYYYQARVKDDTQVLYHNAFSLLMDFKWAEEQILFCLLY